MPHVPPAVAERMRLAFVEADFPQRGAPKAMETFYRHLAEHDRPIECATASDFRAAASSRTRFRTLIWALQAFAPETPLAASRGVAQHWDHWLNSKYNAKPKKERQPLRIALLPEAWPEDCQSAIPLLD